MALTQRPDERTTCCISTHELLVSAKRLRFEKSQPTPLWEMNTSRVWHFWNSTLIGQETSDVGAQPIQRWLREVFWDFYSLKRPHSHPHSHITLPWFALSVSMSYPLVILLCVGLLHQAARAVRMDKLADNKICGDAECSCKSGH